jgi:pyruvate/2-oxoglutarate dehydrogenase complex dihydrolipoamide acyltransferase (E2) component
MAQGEKSTADSPLKDQMEQQQQHDSPRVETHATEDGVSKESGPGAVEYGHAEKDKIDPALNKPDEPTQQDPKPTSNEGPSNQRSPSPEQTDMNQYFESSNEDDFSAQPGGSSIDPQSSTS